MRVLAAPARTYAIGVTTRACRPLATAARAVSAYPVSCTSCIPTRRTMCRGNRNGFSYRILYIAPELIRGALAGRALPFVADPSRSRLRSSADRFPPCRHRDPISELSCAEIAVAVADCLLSLSGRRVRRRARIDLRAVELRA